MHYSFGATLRDGGVVNFRFWAPKMASVELELENETHAMSPVGDGFHEIETACAPGSRYRYRVGPELSVPDPASRLQDGDVHDASIVVDTQSYPWRHTAWRGRPWTETVLYELHVGLAGGFRGAQAMLPELARLGITAVELMPIADFPGPRNWGYDGVLPYAPDRAYGTPDDLRALIDEAHGLGMMVFLDVVYNHFGPNGNYLSSYAPDFYRDDVKTPWGPAIDFRKPQVRAYFAENALYWLREYRFDGLRLDAVHAISDTDWLPEMARFVRQNLDPYRYVHLVLENDDNDASLLGQGFDAQWNDDAHHVLHVMLTGETQGYYSSYKDDPTGKLARCLAEGFIYQGEPSPWRNGQPRGEPSADLPPHAFVFFLQNHDQTGNRAMGERLISLCAGKTDALKAAVALQLLAPHIPMLFMGEECGATVPFLYFTSFEDPDLAQAVRDGRRKEFAGFSAFSDPSARERIPDPNDQQTWNQSKLIADMADEESSSWFAYYRHLLALRAEHVTPYLAEARSVSVQVLGYGCLVASWELGNGDVLSLYCNLTEEDLALPAGMLRASESVIFESSNSPGRGLIEECVPAYSMTATLVLDAGAAARPKEMP
ncbi:malto-oligosyltrehalose trehalohydrolase [Pollutimonas subterranea]|uniref:Malto-oligosyltrehalose trehalohydrolase n=1 Tax=Pollutimonas subterranea TaxID=2045210 RepID=A0A2N4U2M4_9BURK|nr:malto-oligosyltrehalose trehalohydrolase [Pollutimonas subterranea]PLC49264.1 malto-oligosyltrehalose trehalohydrolase [Pollutimonas subterranea]